MTDTSSKTWNMLLMRDPTGGKALYNKDWKWDDSKWTADLKAKVPFGIDPT